MGHARGVIADTDGERVWGNAMANLITVIRLGVLFGIVPLLYTRQPWAVSCVVVLVYLIIASDWVDGIVARWRDRDDQFGAVFDIGGDRVVEMTFWFVFTHLGILPLWIPLTMLTRGFMIDALRAAQMGEGRTAFGKNTMMRSPVTRWLTGSRFMRAFYGVVKVLAFGFLAGLYGARLPVTNGFLAPYGTPVGQAITWFCVYSAVALSLVRGLPVVVDSWDYLRGEAPEQRRDREQRRLTRAVRQRAGTTGSPRSPVPPEPSGD